MIKKKIGKYESFILEGNDVVVVFGRLSRHRVFLKQNGFEENSETKEWIGTGENLYNMPAEEFINVFGIIEGGVAPELFAQTTDGEAVFQVDAFPLVEEREGKVTIVKICALHLDTRKFIEEGVGNFKVG